MALIIGLMSLHVSGCGINDDKVKNVIKVGIALYDEYDPFTATIADEIKKSLYSQATANGEELVCDVVYSGKNQFVQNDQISEFIKNGYDILCINIVDRTDAMQIIDMAKNADVPIIFFNRELVQEDLDRWDKLYYVGAKPELSANYQAQIVIDAFSDPSRKRSLDFNKDGTIQYVILEGEPGHQDAIIRTKLSVETISAAGLSIEKFADEVANWNREQAYTKMMSVLAGHPWQIELILANDDNIALGALEALEEYGVPTLPVIVGVNGQKEVMEKIKEGKIEGTVYNNAYAKGDIIGRMAYGLATTGNVPDDIELDGGKYRFVPYEKVTAKNVDEYLKKAVY